MYVCVGNMQSLRRNQRIQILLISKWKKEHLTIASDWLTIRPFLALQVQTLIGRLEERKEFKAACNNKVEEIHLIKTEFLKLDTSNLLLELLIDVNGEIVFSVLNIWPDTKAVNVISQN